MVCVCVATCKGFVGLCRDVGGLLEVLEAQAVLVFSETKLCDLSICLPHQDSRQHPKPVVIH